MKYPIALLLLALLAACSVSEKDDGYTPLFNGKDINDWTILQRNATDEDAKKIYTIDPDGILHLFRDLPAGTGVETNKNGTHGVLYTKRGDYSRYSLKFEYKWGEKLFNNHSSFQYDSGLIYHITEMKIWPTALQYQIRYDHTKDHNHTGDFVAGGIQIQWYSKDGKTFDWPQEGAQPQPMRRGQHYAHADAPFHGLDDQWNECEIIVMGDEYALHKLNGMIVNMATDLGIDHGPIAIEAETGEIYWRNVRIKEFDKSIPMEKFLK